LKNSGLRSIPRSIPRLWNLMCNYNTQHTTTIFLLFVSFFLLSVNILSLKCLTSRSCEL
jgi:hypothetical protein